MAFYSKHCGPDMSARVTVRPLDISEWEPERTLDLYGKPRERKNITYANPVMLSTEGNALYLFWRGDGWKPTMSKSADNGHTWQAGREIVRRSAATSDNRPYVKITTNNRDRIHVAFTDGHPRNELQNSVYYACYHNGAFFKADGTRIVTLNRLPFEPRQADRVYDASKTGARAWVWDVAADVENNPVIVYTRFPSDTDHRYHYARWNGKEWMDRELTPAGKWFPETPPGKAEGEPYYSGGIVLDHTQPSVVYLSRPVDGIFEIERWFTSDNGQTWKSEAITAGSKFNNVRPCVVRGHDVAGPTVLWLNNRGGYIHYTQYHSAVKADWNSAPVAVGDAKPDAVLALMERVADWQLANPGRHPTTDWTQGALYAGIMALDSVAQSPRFREAMLRIGETNQWKLGPRVYHADDHCVGQMYAELWFRFKEAKMIEPMKQRFDEILTNPPTETSFDWTHKRATDRWAWCDALFMAPPAWIRLWSATGDRRYLDFAVTNCWATSDHLYDVEEHLYFRDSTYFNKREANGKKVFWSRGNGWVMGGLVRMLQYLPADHPARERFIKQFREMAEKLVTCQQPDGLWRSSLLDPEGYPLKETSGSGFYTYAIAWGVNNRLLDRDRFERVIRKAWVALAGCVENDGKLTHVQPIGADPRKFDENHTDVYGVGAFLLAGSEVYRMANSVATGSKSAAVPRRAKRMDSPL
jgi:rhamnogalacturonyl hydrolase YesR